jgi:hypothetical protein
MVFDDESWFHFDLNFLANALLIHAHQKNCGYKPRPHRYSHIHSLAHTYGALSHSLVSHELSHDIHIQTNSYLPQ